MPKARIPECHPDARHYALGWCRKCYKKIEYWRDAPRHRAARLRYCHKNKDALRIEHRAYYLAHTEEMKIANRRSRIARQYGITVEEYNYRLAAQDGCCALCLQMFTSRVCIDHDHETGKVRALLCINCNAALGKFQDDPALIRRAAEYVERFRLVDQWTHSS